MNTDQILDLSSAPDSQKAEVETIAPWKFVLLFTLSFGLYGIWWMYVTWRFFRDKESSDIMPVWRAIFSIFFIYSLFDRILDFAKERGAIAAEYSSGLLAAIFILLNFTAWLPDPMWLLTLLAGLCFIKPIRTFNYAIANSDKYQPERNNGITIGQIIIFVVGGIWWLLVLAGLFLTSETAYGY